MQKAILFSFIISASLLSFSQKNIAKIYSDNNANKNNNNCNTSKIENGNANKIIDEYLNNSSYQSLPDDSVYYPILNELKNNDPRVAHLLDKDRNPINPVSKDLFQRNFKDGNNSYPNLNIEPERIDFVEINGKVYYRLFFHEKELSNLLPIDLIDFEHYKGYLLLEIKKDIKQIAREFSINGADSVKIIDDNNIRIYKKRENLNPADHYESIQLKESNYKGYYTYSRIEPAIYLPIKNKYPQAEKEIKSYRTTNSRHFVTETDEIAATFSVRPTSMPILPNGVRITDLTDDQKNKVKWIELPAQYPIPRNNQTKDIYLTEFDETLYGHSVYCTNDETYAYVWICAPADGNYLSTVGAMEDDDFWSGDEHNYNRIHDKFDITSIPDGSDVTGADYENYLPNIAPFTTGDCDGLLDWEEVWPEIKDMTNNMTPANNIYTDGSVDYYSDYWYDDVENGTVYHLSSGWLWDRGNLYTGYDCHFNASGLTDIESSLAGNWYVVGVADYSENNESPSYWEAVATYGYYANFRIFYIPCCQAPSTVSAFANGSTSTSVCPGSTVALTVSSVGGGCACGSWRYAWSDGTNWWNGSGFSSATPVYNTSYSNINVSVTTNKTYTVRVECSSCGSYNSGSANVSVFSNSTAATSITGTTTLCPGFSTDLTVNGGTLGSGANWVWYSGSCGGTYVGTGTTISVSPGSNTTYFARAEGICNSTTCISQTVTINTVSTAASSASASPATIAPGNSSTLSISGGSLGTGANWVWYTGNCGGTQIGTGNSIVVSPTVNTTYFVRAVGTCNSTECVSVTVYVSGSVTICNGQNVDLSVNGGTLGTGASWYWYSGSCGGTYVGTGSTINVAPTTSTTYYVRGQGTCNTTGCAVMNVIVNNLSTAATSISGTSNICTGGSSTLSVVGGSLGTNASWYWYSGSCGGTYVGTGSSITVSPTSTTTYYVRAEGTCNTTTCPTGFTVTVSPDPTASISSSATSICTGGAIDFTQTTSGGTGTITDQWQYSTDGSSWSNWTTSSNPTYSPFTAPLIFRLIRSASGTGCNSATSNTIEIEVEPDPTITTQPESPDIICVGGTTENMTIAASSGTGSFSYYWQYYNGSSWANVTNGTPTGATYSGGTSTTFSISGISSSGSYQYRCYITQSGSGCGDLTSNSVTVTVEPDPSITITGSATICSGGDAALLASDSGGTGNFTYQWQNSPDGSSWSNISGATSGAYNTPSLTATTYYQAIVSDSGSGCNTATSNSQAITIVSDPSISTHPTGTTICQGDTHTMSVSASGGTPSLTYQWQNSNDGVTWADIIGAENSNFTTPALSSTTYYRVIVDAGGSACDATISNSATVTVDATSDGGTASANPSSTICAGESVELNVAGYTGNIQWQTNASGSWANIAGETSATYNTPILLESTSYRVIAVNGVCSSNYSNTLAITVTIPDITGVSGNDYIWTGATSSTWDGSTTNNWLKFISGSDFEIPASVPNSSDNVFIRSTGICFATPPTVTSLDVAECNNLTIDLGNTLNINSGSNLTILGDLINEGTLNVSGTSPISINGDWNNSGTFTAGSGTVNFVGNIQQVVTTNGETFNNIIINNNSGSNAAILLNNDLRIGGQLTLTNGIVSFANPVRKLILGNSATTNGGNTNSFIDGIVEKLNCNASFTFPTGNVNTRDIGAGMQTYKIWAPITATPTAATTVNARYLYSNIGLNQWWYHVWTHEAPLTHTTDREYWIVNSSSDLNVTLFWKNNNPCSIHDFCEPGPVFNSGDLTIAYWNGIWKDAGGIASSDYITGSITSSGLIPFGAKGEKQITFGAKDKLLPLPIELISLNVYCDKNNATIQWETASETNNDYFIVEKSNDLNEFYEIGRIDGAGNSNNTLKYSLKDNEKLEGINYYRIIQVDTDGSKTTSNIVSTNCKNENEQAVLIAYPNPFTEELNVSIENLKDKEFVLEILDDLGRVVYTCKYSNFDNTFITTINLDQIRPAVYTLRAKSESSILNVKVVKK